jgi:hypothetical protein
MLLSFRRREGGTLVPPCLLSEVLKVEVVAQITINKIILLVVCCRAGKFSGCVEDRYPIMPMKYSQKK